MVGLVFMVIVMQLILIAVNIIGGEQVRKEGGHYGLQYFLAGVCFTFALSVILDLTKL